MDSDWENNLVFSKERSLMFLETGSFSDVSFSVYEEDTGEYKTFKAHKIFLASHSSVFSSQFFGPLAEGTGKAIEILDIKPETFQTMLQCIYTDTVKFKSWNDAGNLFYATKKYMLNGLSKFCLNYIEKNLKADNVLSIYEFAEFYEEKILLAATLRIIRKDTLLVINSPHFCNISLSTLSMILDQDELQANEMDLFEALQKFAKYNGVIGEKGEILVATEETFDLLTKIRTIAKKIKFHSMTIEQFTKGPAQSNLLSPDDTSLIIDCLINPFDLENRYPKDFKRNIRNLKHLPRVFFEVAVDNCPIGHIILELRSDVAPNTSEIFRSLCSGEKLYGYKGSTISKVNKSSHFSFGNTVNIKNGRPVPINPIGFENFILKLSRPGILGMRLNGEKTLGDKFFITYAALEKWNDKCVVFGQVIEGMRVVNTIRTYATDSNKTSKKICITNCGQLQY